MKRTLITAVLFAFGLLLHAQEEKVQIIFDVTSKNTNVHESTIRHITLMSDTYKESDFQVIVYSGALKMLQKDGSTVKEQVEALAKKDNVTFSACALTMKRYKVGKDDLINGVESVPNALLEIVNKQKQGWGYIKESQ